MKAEVYSRTQSLLVTASCERLATFVVAQTSAGSFDCVGAPLRGTPTALRMTTLFEDGNNAGRQQLEDDNNVGR
jgi:hypothetical protein